MQLRFTKMQGIGNDYVYVWGTVPPVQDIQRLARVVSHRRFGVGGDGLILILPSEKADFQMRIFNADGSEGRMCGNGIRCVGKYVHDRGLTDKTHLLVETLSGIRELWLHLDGQGQTETVTVDMGKAVWEPAAIPVVTSLPRFVAQPVTADGVTYEMTCVSMGNPHGVIFCEDVDGLDLERIGPGLECHPLFPERINTEFVRVLERTRLQMRVWERGSGETMACGTGACAVVAAAVERGFCPCATDITVQLRGGDLTIRQEPDGTIRMGGPAAFVFDGVMEYCEEGSNGT